MRFTIFILVIISSIPVFASNMIIELGTASGYVTYFISEEGGTVKEITGKIMAYSESGEYIYAKSLGKSFEEAEYYYFNGTKEKELKIDSAYSGTFDFIAADFVDGYMILKRNDRMAIGLAEIKSGRLVREFETGGKILTIKSDGEDTPLDEIKGHKLFEDKFATYDETGSIDIFLDDDVKPARSIKTGKLGMNGFYIDFQDDTLVYTKDGYPELLLNIGGKAIDIRPEKETFMKVISKYISPDIDDGEYIERWVYNVLDYNGFWNFGVSKDGNFLCVDVGDPTYGYYTAVFDNVTYKFTEIEYKDSQYNDIVDSHPNELNYPYYDKIQDGFIAYNNETMRDEVASLGYQKINFDGFVETSKYLPKTNQFLIPVNEFGYGRLNAVISYSLENEEAKLLYKVPYNLETELLASSKHSRGISIVYVDSNFENKRESTNADNLADRAIYRYKEYETTKDINKLKAAYKIANEAPLGEFLGSDDAKTFLQIRTDYCNQFWSIEDYKLDISDIHRYVLNAYVDDPTFVKLFAGNIIFVANYSYLAPNDTRISETLYEIVKMLCGYTDEMMVDDTIMKYMVDDNILSLFYEMEFALDNEYLVSEYTEKALKEIGRTTSNFQKDAPVYSIDTYDEMIKDALKNRDFEKIVDVYTEILSNNIEEIENDTDKKDRIKGTIEVNREFAAIQDLIDNNDLRAATLRAGAMLKSYMDEANTYEDEANSLANIREFEKSEEKLAELKKFFNYYLSDVSRFANSVFSRYVKENDYKSFMQLSREGSFSEYIK